MSKREYVLDSLYEDIPKEDYNENWCAHDARFRELLQKGLLGFIGGALFFGCSRFMFHAMGSNSSSMELSKAWSIILLSLVYGLGCVGFPLGWELLNKLIGHWSIWGNVFIVVSLFVFKLGIALVIGMIVYPIALIYHFIQSRKSKKTVKRCLIIIISIVVLFNCAICVVAVIEGLTGKGASSSTPKDTTPSVIQVVDPSIFDGQPEVLKAACQHALTSAQASEHEDANSNGWQISTPSKIHGVFFLTSENPEVPHYNYLKGIEVTNAVAVVSGYFVTEASGISIDQWEMELWVYPNYTIDQHGVLSNDTENRYSHQLRSDDMEDFMAWFNSEYNDMVITELTIPEI